MILGGSWQTEIYRMRVWEEMDLVKSSINVGSVVHRFRYFRENGPNSKPYIVGENPPEDSATRKQ